MIGFAYHAIQNAASAPAEIKEKIERLYYSTVSQQMQQEYFASKLLQELQQKSIPHMPLKGLLLRPLYPSPDLRLSCDIDFLYPIEHRQAVDGILSEMGFSCTKKWVHHDIYTMGHVTIEPHFALTDPNSVASTYYQGIWDRLVSVDGSAYRFTDEDFYIFMLYHMSKHFREGGVGVRAILDVFLYLDKHPNLNRVYIEEELQKLRIQKFGTSVVHLAHTWFGNEPATPDMDLLGDFVLNGGAYGSARSGAQIHHTKQTKKGKVSPRRAKRSYLCAKLFPPFAVMRCQYPSLSRLPFLLPFYYVIRWVAITLSPSKRAGAKRAMSLMNDFDIETAQSIAQILTITGMDDINQ